MSKTITQIIKTDNEDGTGNVTVIATDDSGKQTAISKDYNNNSYSPSDRQENIITTATQEALDK